MNIKNLKREFSLRERLTLVSLTGFISSIILGFLTIFGAKTLDSLDDRFISIICVPFILVGILVTILVFMTSLMGFTQVVYSYYDINVLEVTPKLEKE